ncbi:hypothetical protein [Vibrio ziniensis]|uniref:Uncharacterized protein n=1 Tax=Vibrio ziniensis TaxID=2711221 RepID=A0A6G7CMU6_9VIBR|nr:hypothetical protein [Vibrio ziniensis]QIH43457.1 hypothetical protein G5S32_15785 [Vibrio ziniensis]
MSLEFPLGAPRYRGNGDTIYPRKFEGALVAGVAVSVGNYDGSQPIVTTYNGSAFGGFSVHDLDSARKVTGVIKTGDGICLRMKEGAALTVGGAFAVDNVTGEVVEAGADGSTTIMGDVAAIDVFGIDADGSSIENCVLVNAYGGAAPAGSGGSTGIPEAPIDGTPYSRQDGGWVAATAAAPVPPTEDTPAAKSGAKK